MEIIQKETVKEVPVDYYCDKYSPCGYGYNYGCGRNSWGWGVPNSQLPASRGVAGSALGLGIAGTVLGLGALAKNGGLGLFGGNNSNMPENVNINTTSMPSNGFGWSTPSAFQVWAKESDDIFAAQKALYDYALLDQNQRFIDRQTLNSELFGVYKSQIDADFGLYKSQRDANDLTNNRLTSEIFSLYKETRDKDDEIRKELCDLKAQVAINAAIRPYQDKLIQCDIHNALGTSIGYTDRKTCNVLYGQVVLPNTPEITGFAGANRCGCPTVITAAAGA